MIALNRNRSLPIGLHLSSRSARLVQLAGPPGRREVYATASGELPQLDEASPEEQDRERAAALKRLVADHHFKGRSVVSCLGGEELFVQNVRLPQLPAEEVDRVVRWEAEERLPYPVAEAEIRHLLAGEVRQESQLKQEVILLACHRGIIERHIHLLEQAGLTPSAIDIEPCAVMRCLQETPTASGGRLAYLHLGEQTTTVMFVEGERVLFLKYISSGGRQLDAAVARHLEMGLPEAARMRSTVTAAEQLDPDDEVHRSVTEAIRHPLESISTEIELCLRYYKVTFRGKPLERVIVTGSEACRWLCDFLAEPLGMPCELGDPLEALARRPTAPSVLDRPGRWTTAMGLSAR